MPETTWEDGQLNAFRDAAQSLKLFRRAELQDETSNRSIIDELYVDPLPSDHVFNIMVKPNTTFIVGRKGTGKSTVFQRAQHEIRKQSTYATAYVDIKTVYESSQTDPALLQRLDDAPDTLPRTTLEKLLLYRSFLQAIILEIKEELRAKITSSVWSKIKNSFGGTMDDLFRGLDDVLNDAMSTDFKNVMAIRRTSTKASDSATDSSKNDLGAKVGLQPHASAELTLSASSSRGYSTSEERDYSDILIQTFHIKEFIVRIRDLLGLIGVSHLYIFVDDFSELPEQAMHVVVDSLLAPLNNWSEELIKFKIAAYPSRIYYGAIDKSKIDEVNLDLFRMYGSKSVSEMEIKAMDFTKRLIERRMEHYGAGSILNFCDQEAWNVWRDLFYATMANPRILGHTLFYLYEQQLIYGKPITRSAIREAAQRYYEEKVDAYFRMNKFLLEAFDERSSVYSLKELLEAIVRRSQELRSYRDSLVFQRIKGRPPTSHFFVVSEYDGLLSSLDLNFFITKYYEQKDREGRDVSIYALNYGLCQKYSISFGRPRDAREDRLYFIERVFDYNPIIQRYLEMNQEIVCDNCGTSHDIGQLGALRLFAMLCPACRHGTCRVTNLSRKYESVLREVDAQLLLPATELGILQTLWTERRKLNPAQIGEQLDCSYQLVGWRGKNLAERGLVNRSRAAGGRRQFELRREAEEIYFSEDLRDELDVLE